MRGVLRLLVQVLALFLLAGFTAEVVLRVIGYAPFRSVTQNIMVSPGGVFFQTDSITGYNTFPGQFTISLNDTYDFSVTHNADNARVTRDSILVDPHQKIWLLGCSYTYGWSLNDYETFSYKLQNIFPDVSISNYGKPGFSNLQSYLQFKELLQRDTPDIVVLNYASFHDDRNIGSKNWLLTLAEHNRLGPLKHPVLRAHEDSFLIETVELENLSSNISKHSALAHFIERRSNRPSLARRIKATKHVINLFSKQCENYNVKLGIAGITLDQRTQDVLDYCRAIGIPSVMIGIDLSKPLYLNRPHDNHPNGLANSKYADQLHPFLKTLMNN